MHGSPLLRALLLTASLAVVGLLLAAVAGTKESDPTPPPVTTPVTKTLAILSLQLSSPATKVTLTSLNGKATLLHLDTPPLDSEHPLQVPVTANAFTGLLSVTWQTPGNTNFLRLRLEPEQLESRELLLHAPANLEQHAIEFDWLDN